MISRQGQGHISASTVSSECTVSSEIAQPVKTQGKTLSMLLSVSFATL